MSGYRPYDEYEPNEPERPGRGAADGETPPERSFYAQRPAGPEERREWTADVWTRPVSPERGYAQRTWDEEDYLPNEPAPEEARPVTAAPTPEETGARRRRAGGENPYARPTWDETTYPLRPAPQDAVAQDAAYGGESKSAPLRFDADADTSPGPVYAPSAPDVGRAEGAPNASPYARPEGGAEPESRDWSERYAPPLRFEMPGVPYAEENRATREEAPYSPNVYRTRQAAAPGADDGGAPHGRDYRVEADAPRERRKHTLRRWLIALLVLAVLGAAAWLERDWVLRQIRLLFGDSAVETVQQAVGAELTAAGFDAAPAQKVGASANKNINAVAGGLGLEPFAVTGANVVERVATGKSTYDYYLFAASDGKLLGYYEGLSADGFLVCPDDIFYAAMPPYLIDKAGNPLLNTERFAQNAGAGPVLGPMVNGWALIGDANMTTFNYVDADGSALSPLWFSKAYPFTADATVAYVDTGNVTNPEERYALYVLTRDGRMSLWEHAADMNSVLGCACGVVYRSDGRLLLLDDARTQLCVADDVSVYADCGAVVARDAATGKRGLFVDGVRQYDFDYDGIGPNATDEPLWRLEADGAYKLYTVTGMAYPLPLSHYFIFTKGGTTETVALSTASVYPLMLTVQK